MSGTIVDYSKTTDSVHFIKILSGEKLYTFYLDEHPADARLDMLVVFDPVAEDWRPM